MTASYKSVAQSAATIEGFDFSLPTEALLVGKITDCLDFARRAIQHLVVEGHAADEREPWFVRNEKIIAETCFLLAFTRNNQQHVAIADAVSKLVKILQPLARSHTILLNICLKPRLALDYAQAHICLDYAGYPNEKFDRAVRAALACCTSNQMERTPYRNMEVEWLKSIWNADYVPRFDLWLPVSCLSYPIDLFDQGSDGVYAITHAVMYAAFWERQIEGVDKELLFQIIEAFLIRYLDEQNYDIAGELLMAWPLLNETWSPVAAFALHCLFEIEKRVGFLPAPGIDRSRIDGAEQTSKRTYIYSINYHTVLVMGLLYNCLLGKPVQNEPAAKRSELTPLSLERIYEEISGAKEVHWKQFFNICGKEDRKELMPMLYQVCLFRWIQQKKYAKVDELLRAGDNILQNLPTSRQALELLQRLGLVMNYKTSWR